MRLAPTAAPSARDPAKKKGHPSDTLGGLLSTSHIVEFCGVAPQVVSDAAGSRSVGGIRPALEVYVKSWYSCNCLTSLWKDTRQFDFHRLGFPCVCGHPC